MRQPSMASAPNTPAWIPASACRRPGRDLLSFAANITLSLYWRLGKGKIASVRHRAVITGIGAVSPNGIGREQFWDATKQGQSGVRRITRFDPSGLQVQIAGEVAGFDETAYVEVKDRQHVSRCVPLGV